MSRSATTSLEYDSSPKGVNPNASGEATPDPSRQVLMGGQIMIHGHGSHEDWTEGCVAVNDDVMDILWKYCPIKTPIIIKP